MHRRHMKIWTVIAALPAVFFLMPPGDSVAEDSLQYTIGVNDVLNIAVLKPDQLTTTLTVSPDGTITFPYIGNVEVQGKTLAWIQQEVQSRLAAYMKYPVVSVSLQESKSRMFYVYGEVIKPGAYGMQPNLTVIRAISVTGGFTKYGSASKVKILRRLDSGNEIIRVDVDSAMEGDSSQDIGIKDGDVITVSEGIF